MLDVMPLPPLLRDLLREERLAPLGPGTPNPEARAELAGVSVEMLFAPHTVADRGAVAACLAGLWLAFNVLDEAHALSQELHTPEGSYWHGILHRREPDSANAAYWFRRVGAHPAFGPLRAGGGAGRAGGPAGGRRVPFDAEGVGPVRLHRPVRGVGARPGQSHVNSQLIVNHGLATAYRPVSIVANH